MMKKIIALLAVLTLSLSGCMMPQQNQEQAELKIETYETAPFEEVKNPSSHELAVIDQHLYTMASNLYLGIYHAQIKNIGTENVLLSVDSLKIVDESGNEIFTINEFATAAPTILEPGTTAYVTTSQLMDSLSEDAVSKISDYSLIFTGEPTEESPKDTSHLSAEGLNLIQEEAALAGVVHNSSGDNLKNVTMVVTVFDGEGNLLMAEAVVVPSVSANGQAEFKKEVASPNPTSDYENVVVSCIFY